MSLIFLTFISGLSFIILVGFLTRILDDGKKSLAIEITIQPKTETLTDDEIDDICKIVINKVEKSTGGKLRSQ